MRSQKAFSSLTSATIQLTSQQDIDEPGAIGEPAHIEVTRDGEAIRHFQLVVVAVSLQGLAGGVTRRYRIELAHELDLLRLRSDVRIFQDKNAQEIVAEVLDGAGVDAGHVSYSLQRTPETRDYCVQYRETDWNFVSRLIQHEGIFFFTHDDASQTNVTFGDAQSLFVAIEGEQQVRAEDRLYGRGVQRLQIESRVTSASVSLGDYNMESPASNLTRSAVAADGAFGDWFEYTAGHQNPDQGDVLARIRLEEVVARRVVGRGESNMDSFRAGCWVELVDAAAHARNGKYLLTSVHHRWALRRAAAGDDSEPDYRNRFSCIPHETVFRPQRSARRPRITGSHSAVVTGPAGAEIHTDEHGRMKGHFFWDRVGQQDDTSSRWMRVTQLPISGSMALARMGWEMSVLYFDGDPDRPIAVSRLYTAERASPYGYPAAKTRMALQTPSSPASGKSNEFRMEDGAGGMEMFVNASKDFDGQTNNIKTETIGVDESLEVGVDCKSAIGADQAITIGGNETKTVAGQATVAVKADRTKTVGGSETVSVSKSVQVAVDGSDSETTGGTHTTLTALGIDRSATGSQSLTVGGSMISAAGLGVGLAVAGAKSETVGAAKICASAASVSESIVGAYACTVGGALVQASAANRIGNTKGACAVTVGGLLAANAGGDVTIKGKKVAIRVLGVANFLGGGGVLTLTAASASFAGLVTVDASGSVKVSGNPNVVG